MHSKRQLDRLLCYVYMGQHTGKHGLLKDDLKMYKKVILQNFTQASGLVEMGLIVENNIPGPPAKSIGPMQIPKHINPTMLKTTKQGEKDAREIMKTAIANATNLLNRLKGIPNRILLFLIKHELLKLDGSYPVDLRDPPSDYVKDSLDIQRDMFNCLLLPLKNPRLNLKLLDARERLFNTLISMGLCVTASAYQTTPIFDKHSWRDRPKIGVDIDHLTHEHKLNYCVPPDVLHSLSDLFKRGIKSFELPKELQQGHIHYHSLKELLKTWCEEYEHIFSNGTGSWSQGVSRLELIGDPGVAHILNDMKTRKLLFLSNDTIQYEGNTWRRLEISSEKECLRYLEHHCLEPILNFLSDAGTRSVKKDEGELQGEQIDIIIDGNNVAYDNVPKGKPPRYRNILLAREYYKRKKLKTKVIVDASLRHDIDEREAFQKALDSQLISQSPSRVSADEYMFKLALSHQKSKMLSNDDFKDWKAESYYSGDLRMIRLFKRRERFVKFKINGKFIEFPMRNSGRY